MREITHGPIGHRRPRWGPLRMHHAVIDLAVAQRDDVEGVVLVEPPWPLGALPRHLRDRALHIARREIQRRQFGYRRIEMVGRALSVALAKNCGPRTIDNRRLRAAFLHLALDSKMHRILAKSVVGIGILLGAASAGAADLPVKARPCRLPQAGRHLHRSAGGRRLR